MLLQHPTVEQALRERLLGSDAFVENKVLNWFGYISYRSRFHLSATGSIYVPRLHLS